MATKCARSYRPLAIAAAGMLTTAEIAGWLAHSMLRTVPAFVAAAGRCRIRGKGDPHSLLRAQMSLWFKPASSVAPVRTLVNCNCVTSLFSSIARAIPSILTLLVFIAGSHCRADRPASAPMPLKSPFSAETAKGKQDEWARYLNCHVVVTNSVGMKLVLVPPGEFLMGSPNDEVSDSGQHSADEMQHQVHITNAFYVGMYEVTQSTYQRVMGVNPASNSMRGNAAKSVRNLDTSQFPVESVTWADAQEFCTRLGRLEHNKYRLPTEAEWEYSCRAGTATAFDSGSSISTRQANFLLDASKGPGLLRPTTVGSYPSNAFGLYDMHGNVAQWCLDWYDERFYSRSSTENPVGPSSGAMRVARGGGWLQSAVNARSAARDHYDPKHGSSNVGFRVVQDVAVPDKHHRDATK